MRRTHFCEEDRAKSALISWRLEIICWRRSRITLCASARSAWSITGNAGLVATGGVAPKPTNGVCGTALTAAAAADAVSKIDPIDAGRSCAAVACSTDVAATAAADVEGVDAASSGSCARRASMVTITDEPLRRR